jgi:transcriptional regulator of arginine metabolism
LVVEKVMTTKTQRQAALIKLLEAEKLSSHEEILDRLKEQDIQTTQATISRDLFELGAARVPSGAAWHYQLSNRGSEFGASLSFVWQQYVVSTVISQNIIILKTPPGHAGVVAAALDRANIDGIGGVLAGDDTIFICCLENSTPQDVISLINQSLLD